MNSSVQLIGYRSFFKEASGQTHELRTNFKKVVDYASVIDLGATICNANKTFRSLRFEDSEDGLNRTYRLIIVGMCNVLSSL